MPLNVCSWLKLALITGSRIERISFNEWGEELARMVSYGTSSLSTQLVIGKLHLGRYGPYISMEEVERIRPLISMLPISFYVSYILYVHISILDEHELL